MKSAVTACIASCVQMAIVVLPLSPHPRVPISHNLTLMGFTLGKSTFADVEKELGRAVVQRSSAADSASDQVCYRAPEREHVSVVFESGPSGGWSTLDGYKVSARPIASSVQCTIMPHGAPVMATAGGLRLGLTLPQVEALLGTPRLTRRNHATFQWSARRPMTKKEIRAASETYKAPVSYPYFDILDTIEVEVAKSKVIQFTAHHTVTD